MTNFRNRMAVVDPVTLEITELDPQAIIRADQQADADRDWWRRTVSDYHRTRAARQVALAASQDYSVWKSSGGRRILLPEMETRHIRNTIAYLKRRAEAKRLAADEGRFDEAEADRYLTWVLGWVKAFDGELKRRDLLVDRTVRPTAEEIFAEPFESMHLHIAQDLIRQLIPDEDGEDQ